MPSKLFFLFFFLCMVFAGLFWKESARVLKKQPTSWFKDQKADCAVVFTGGPGRVGEGIDLLARSQVKKLIISGVFPGAHLNEIFPRLPYYGNLNPKDVVLEKRSETTYGNAIQSTPLVEALNCRDLILVTSRLHMYRASKTFRAQLSDGFLLHERAIVSGQYKPTPLAVFSEVSKSIFYSLWAY